MKLKKKFIVKIPNNIQVIYCKKKNLLQLKNSFKAKSLKLKVKLMVFASDGSNCIVVSKFLARGFSVIEQKNSKALRGTTVSEIKTALVELQHSLFIKLKLVGVGFRGFNEEPFHENIFFKLGFSHPVYFRLPHGVKVFIKKYTTVILLGDVPFNRFTQFASQIRSCKVPEPYKGKGILYYDEKIELKKGKRV